MSPLIAALIVLLGMLFIWMFFMLLDTIKFSEDPETKPPLQQNQIKRAEAPSRDEHEINYETGLIFEQYVLSLFSNFVIEDVTSDYYNKANRIFVESSMNPDFRIRHDPSKTVFAIECKFRTSTYWDNGAKQHLIKWSYPDQITRYNNYQRKNNIPVCILIGLGNPSMPTDMFLIPLNHLPLPIITKTKLFQYKRSAQGPFTWAEIKHAIES